MTDEPVSGPAPRRRLRPVVIGLVVALLALGGWGIRHLLTRDAGDPRAQLDTLRETADAQTAELEQLRQRVVTLARSDQISREANRDLQSTLAERDEEIAALRADVAFYERLVGATSQRRGLTVHALRMQPQAGNAWHFTGTLTQNLNRGVVSSGRLLVSIEGTRGGRLQRLDWAELRQQADAPGVEYSFRYFQQVEGDVVLPAGFVPVRVTVRLVPRSGAPVEQSFTWAEITGGEGAGAGIP